MTLFLPEGKQVAGRYVDLRCPWCHGRVPGMGEANQAWWLAKHVLAAHPGELRILELAIVSVRSELLREDRADRLLGADR